MKTTIKLGALSLITAAFLSGCGNSTTTVEEPTNSNTTTEENTTNSNATTEESTASDAPTESNIPYLKSNHANYSNHGSTTSFPTPTKDEAKKSIDWAISATTEDGAKKLADHIQFMVNKLKNGDNPRAWDKLFLMEEYMKTNHHYTTEIEQTGTTVTVSKVATTSCAYEVISAHADAVSGDFFAQGIINKDNSLTAESILADSVCSNEKTQIEAYILENQKPKGQ